MGLQSTARFVKHAVRAFRGQDLWQGAQIKCDRRMLGNDGACWYVCPQDLSASSVVYSMGVGEDISFYLDLIQRFGLQVHAFDPTPRSSKLLHTQSVPLELQFS